MRNSSITKSTSGSNVSSATSSISESASAISRFKVHLRNLQKTWGPLMAAKEDWDDEYNFPPGRYAGQEKRK
ncbi:hypothetical protein N7495_006775 [Penicillium taxi]|uniref:uncharacterized protein n=1 Tax=Penicillium taxi TaxID=168475 RepID=UPI0025455D0D|nr:uncharacterized protein N7495_006775 [Penicillium taxi]KAJ5895084.1 hypothetical protein N7495_006775 [Penicillium taxi]